MKNDTILLMVEKKVFVIGEISETFSDYLESNQIFYRILQSTVATRVNTRNKDKTISADFNNEVELIEIAKKIQSEHGFNVTITEFENYIYYSAIISESLGLKTISPESAIACTDKEIMRSQFSRSPLDISPNFSTIETPQAAILFADTHGYPVVIKAAGLAKSLLVMVCKDETSLQKNCQQMFASIDEVYSRIAPLKQPKVIIEEFMSGSVHSVEGYCDDNGNYMIIPHIVDCVTGADIGRDDNYHYKLSLPSTLNEDEKTEAYKVCEEGMRMLNMKNSAAHIEFIMTPKGPKLIEIGARNGGYRSRMYELANNIDIYDAWLTANSGELPKIRSTRNVACCEIDFVPEKSGIYAGIDNVDALKNLESLQVFIENTHLGQKTGRALDGYRPCAYAILSNEDQEQMERDIAFIDSSVSVITKPM